MKGSAVALGVVVPDLAIHSHRVKVSHATPWGFALAGGPLKAVYRCVGCALACVCGAGGVVPSESPRRSSEGLLPSPWIVVFAPLGGRRRRDARHVPQVATRRGFSAISVKRAASTTGGSWSHSAGVRFET